MVDFRRILMGFPKGEQNTSAGGVDTEFHLGPKIWLGCCSQTEGTMSPVKLSGAS
jgi:hypothetical protein